MALGTSSRRQPSTVNNSMTAFVARSRRTMTRVSQSQRTREGGFMRELSAGKAHFLSSRAKRWICFSAERREKTDSSCLPAVGRQDGPRNNKLRRFSAGIKYALRNESACQLAASPAEPSPSISARASEQRSQTVG